MTEPPDALPIGQHRRPFDYVHPTVAELCAVLGPKWVVARRTARTVARYGSDVTCVTPERMRKVEADIIAKRGWARPAEKVIADLLKAIDCVRPGCLGSSSIEAVNNAKLVLSKARTP